MKKILQREEIFCKSSTNQWNMRAVKDIEAIYSLKKKEIKKRLDEFWQIWKNGSEEEIFAELVFCILTPQSKAKSSWNAVLRLIDANLLVEGTINKIAKELNGVRFKYKKSKYIVEARKIFREEEKIRIRPKIEKFDDEEKRVWLVKNVKGLGYKESSHFLRNVGFGKNFAILDRHILKNLKLLEVIENIASSLSKKRYLEIEKRINEFAGKIKIPMSHLDLVLWYKETGEIFK